MISFTRRVAVVHITRDATVLTVTKILGLQMGGGVLRPAGAANFGVVICACYHLGPQPLNNSKHSKVSYDHTFCYQFQGLIVSKFLQVQ